MKRYDANTVKKMLTGPTEHIFKKTAETMATAIRAAYSDKHNHEIDYKYPAFAEWKRMEQTCKTLGIDLEYEFRTAPEITAVIVGGCRVEI